ncbi:MAG: VTT domain-containing protein [Candidatus Aenigmatarchaeota archaeon]
MLSIEELGLLGLFANTFLAASILPLPSEPSIVLAAGFFNPWLVLIVSVIGGVLGAATNYYIGLKGLHNFFAKRSPRSERKARKLLEKYGILVLLVAPWIPFVGDPMMIAVGALKMEKKVFFPVITVARIIKTVALIFLSIGLFSLG